MDANPEVTRKRTWMRHRTRSHGTLRPEQTPGGGLTMIMAMPAAGHGAGHQR